MIAYKFLQMGRVALFSGQRWSEDDQVEADGPLVVCQNGVHGCRVSDLPYWLDHELWEIELEGELVDDELKLVARRGRLVRRIEAWNDEVQRAFAGWCLHRVAEHAADELRDVSLEAEASALVRAATPNEVAAAAQSAVEAARAASAANAERLASYVADAVAWTKELPPSGVAYVAAYAADSRSRANSPDPFASERALQAEWLEDRLGLTSRG